MASATGEWSFFAAGRDAQMAHWCKPMKPCLYRRTTLNRCLPRRDLDTIRNQAGQQPPPATLLHLLLRHSMLLEYTTAAASLLIKWQVAARAASRA